MAAPLPATADKEKPLKTLALAGSCLLAVVTAAVSLAAPTGARAETSIVVDVASGKVLSQNDAMHRWYPASTTKLMTAYLALKALETGKATLDTPVIMTRFAASQAPSKMGFEPGSVMRLDMALRMMLVKSANDVAVAIAQTVGGGSIETFVGMMNAEAADLGMRDSHFINPNGLPGPGQYSSAKDLALLAVRLRRDFPAFSEIFGVEAISTGDVTIHNTNSLLGRYDGADGMKTGYICASGFNLVASATRQGRTLVAVVLGGDGPIVRDRQAAELLENGFKADPKTASTTIEQLPQGGGVVADISKDICSPAGQKARAEERQREAARKEQTPSSPYLHEMNRPPSTVVVALGGAAGSDRVEAGISQIAAFGIPIPTWRPAGGATSTSAAAVSEAAAPPSGTTDEEGKTSRFTSTSATGASTDEAAGASATGLRGGVAN